MAQYVVVPADPLPAVDGPPSNYAVYRVTAADAVGAATAVATALKSTDPLITYVVAAASFVRYTSTPTLGFVSALS
jgi:hypothetical protein